MIGITLIAISIIFLSVSVILGARENDARFTNIENRISAIEKALNNGQKQKEGEND